MPPERDTDLAAQWKERSVGSAAVPELTAALTSQLCAKYQAQTGQHFGRSIFKKLLWQCLIEKRHRTQNKIPQCLPSHPISRGTVFRSLFLAKELSLHDGFTFPTDTYCIPHANTHFGWRRQ